MQSANDNEPDYPTPAMYRIYSLVAGIITGTIAYLIVAFIYWDIHASDWHWSGRVLFIAMLSAVVFFVLTAAAASDGEE